MSDPKIKIDVQVTGDAKGAEVVAEGLKKVETAAKQTTTAVGPGPGLSGKLAALFPTFTRGAQAIGQGTAALREMAAQMGGMSGAILSGLLNPWALAATGITAAAAQISEAVRAVDTRTRAFLTWAAKGWDDLGLAINRTKTVTDDTAASSRAFEAAVTATKNAIESEIAALQRRETAAKQQISDDEALAASALRLAQIRIDAALADGKITAEQAAAQTTALAAQSAEEAYARNAAASAAALTAKAEALAKIVDQTQQLRALESAAAAEAATFAGKDTRTQADLVDPMLNKQVDNNRRDMQISARDAQDPGLLDRTQGMKDAIDTEMSWWEKMVPVWNAIESIRIMRESWTQTTERTEAATKLLEESTRATAEAERNRDEAIRRAEQIKRDTANKAAAAATAAAAQAGALQQQVDTTTVPDTQSPISPGDIAALPQSDQRDQLMATVIDGIERREIALIDNLIKSLSLLNRNETGGTAAAIKRLEAQIADLRQKN